jgi:hypothetical protein
MNKFLVAGLLIALTAILMIPNNLLTPNVTNAVSCKGFSQSGSHSSSRDFPPAITGSCATSTAAFGGKFSNSGLVQNNGPTIGAGKNGACESRSAGSTGIHSDFDTGFGNTVICSAHSP